MGKLEDKFTTQDFQDIVDCWEKYKSKDLVKEILGRKLRYWTSYRRGSRWESGSHDGFMALYMYHYKNHPISRSKKFPLFKLEPRISENQKHFTDMDIYCIARELFPNMYPKEMSGIIPVKEKTIGKYRSDNIPTTPDLIGKILKHQKHLLAVFSEEQIKSAIKKLK